MNSITVPWPITGEAAYSNRTTPAVGMNNYYQDAWGGIQVRPIDRAYFGNCIIYGNKEYELGIDEHPSSKIPFHFDHSLVKVDPEEFDLVRSIPLYRCTQP